MKARKILCLTGMLLLVFTSTRAQKRLNQGKVFFDISYPGLQPELKSMEASLPKDATVYFKEGKVRVEMPMIAGKSTTISDDKSHNVVVLINMMGKKFAIKKTAEDISKMETALRDSGRLPDIKVLLTGEEKTILGYPCKRALILLQANGRRDTNECWFTTALPKMAIASEKSFDAIDGFMMEYMVEQNGVKLKMKVRQVFDEKIDDKLFTIPDTYKIVTEEELAKILMEEEK